MGFADHFRRWVGIERTNGIDATGRTNASETPGGDPTVQATIDAILARVRDPESGLAIADLGLVRRIRFVDAHKLIYLDVPFDEHAPACFACVGITMTIVAGIRRELTTEFEQSFPGYRVEFI